jgi:hypothetical protein
MANPSPPITVGELIDYLSKFDRNRLVVQEACSDYVWMGEDYYDLPELEELVIKNGRPTRYYEWQWKGTDLPQRKLVLVFKGN